MKHVVFGLVKKKGNKRVPEEDDRPVKRTPGKPPKDRIRLHADSVGAKR